MTDTEVMQSMEISMLRADIATAREAYEGMKQERDAAWAAIDTAHHALYVDHDPTTALLVIQNAITEASLDLEERPCLGCVLEATAAGNIDAQTAPAHTCGEAK